MNCHSARSLLDLHAEGRLSPRRERSVDLHLATCPACRALAERREAAPGPKAPESLKARLAAAAKAARGTAVPKPARTLTLWPTEAPGIALAAAALALVGALIWATGAPSQSPRGAVAAVEEP